MVPTEPARTQAYPRTHRRPITRGRRAPGIGGGRNGRTNRSAPFPRSTSAESQLRVIPLGGLEEVGKNMTAFEYGRDIIVVDLGLMFPSEDMPGIDYVVPDYHYLQQHQDRIKALVITHGHLDHIGAIPYLLTRIGTPPVYATRLTVGLIQEKLEEFNLTSTVMVKEFHPDDTIKLGAFELSFFRVNHNIPDGVGIAIKSPLGTIVHTGDFKIDFTPRDEQPAELHKIAKLGGEGVLMLMSDSTNAEHPGSSISERDIGKNLDHLIEEAPGRVIVSTFATLVSRVQQVFDAAEHHNRKVAISGYSLERTIDISIKLGAMHVKRDMFVRLRDIDNYPDNKVIIISTGSQGQENSALGRMSRGEHRQIKIKQGDTVLLSSSPIPGNERAVQNLMNGLFRLGAKVIYNKIFDLHTSGHGYQNDLRLMLALTKPKYFMPIHGERHMLEAHATLATDMGIPRDNIFILSNGSILEMAAGRTREVIARISKTRIPNTAVLVDGLGVGDIGEVVLRDRQVMAQDGMFVIIVTINHSTHALIGDPEIISRGFMYMKGNDKLIKETVDKVKDICKAHTTKKVENWSPLRNALRDDIGIHLFQKTERRPMILPVVIEV
ncbi:MAG: RNA-metabolising metallo-beta-lactamase [Parcubacteria group bacterium GW2011_GWA2_43_13]|nr:MAG: RNA-metabolising metallo-beta-lactamase [Parcubacteria group bacterium GW2011_GWA2_43_13]HAZ17026.1 ribonuclease J [Candidatus Jacksonbacteria bacterium]